MLLGQIAVVIQDQHNVLETVVRIFEQRLFHPNSNLDGCIVVEFGKIAAITGVRWCTISILQYMWQLASRGGEGGIGGGEMEGCHMTCNYSF